MKIWPGRVSLGRILSAQVSLSTDYIRTTGRYRRCLDTGRPGLYLARRSQRFANMLWGSFNSYNNANIYSGSNQPATNSTWGKVLNTAEQVSDVAWSLLMARGHLRPIDYVALGARSIKAGMCIYSTWNVPKAVNLSSYFDYPGSQWGLCSAYICSLAFVGLEIHEKIVETHKVTKSGKVEMAVYTAIVDGVEIGWVSSPNQSTIPNHIWSKTPSRVRDIAARRLWEKAGSDKIVRIQGERTSPYYLPPLVIETAFLRTVETRARRFLDRGVPRAMILDGEPGTGKSTAAGQLARKLNFKTVIINADDFCARKQDRDGSYAAGAQLAEILKPDVLIVNDIDRVSELDQLQLLDLFDNAKAYARLVFATTNRYRFLTEPVRRPGRLDDLIHVPGLSLAEILHVAPSLAPVAEQMLGWPIAYVKDMQDRFEALGTEAFAELPEVARRLAEVREDGKYTIPLAPDEPHSDAEFQIRLAHARGREAIKQTLALSRDEKVETNGYANGLTLPRYFTGGNI